MGFQVEQAPRCWREAGVLLEVAATVVCRVVELADLAHKAVVAPPRRAESLASVLKVVAMIVSGAGFALFENVEKKWNGKSRCVKWVGVDIRTPGYRSRNAFNDIGQAFLDSAPLLSPLISPLHRKYITRVPHQAGRSLHQTVNPHFFFACHALHMWCRALKTPATPATPAVKYMMAG